MNRLKKNRNKIDVEVGIPVKIKQKKYIRKTYYLTPEQIKAIKIYAAKNDLQISEIMRKAIDEFLEKYYLNETS